MAPLVSVIVPSFNGAHLLPTCLDSLAHQSYASLEVIVADGASSDSTAHVMRRYPEIRLLRLSRNAGFSGNVNAGLRAARGEVICLLNNDARAGPDWIAACVEVLGRQSEIGSVASKVVFEHDGTINSAGDVFCRDGIARQRGNGEPDGGEWGRSALVFGAMGGAAAYKRSMLADVGLFDEGFFMYLEDVDLAFRAQLRGWSCLYEPTACVHHQGSASGGGPLASFYTARNMIRLLAKDLPSGLVSRVLPAFIRFQSQRTREALESWRGEAARATLHGQLAGLAGLGRHLSARSAVQRRRRISDEALYALFSPVPL